MVTGTDFNGRIYDTTDDRSKVVQVKNHRTLFWLKHRARRKHSDRRARRTNAAGPSAAVRDENGR